MKKILKFAFAIVAMAGVVFASSSCGKDEEKNINDYLGDKNIPLPIEEDIFYVSEQTTSSITCKWDDIDYDSCVIKIYDAIIDRLQGHPVSIGPTGHMKNDDELLYKYENEKAVVVKSGTEYTFTDLKSEAQIGLKYCFYKQNVEIKSGIFHTMTIDGTKYASCGSFDLGEVWNINNKKWVAFEYRMNPCYHACNLERLFTLEDSLVSAINAYARVLVEVKPFSKGFHFITEEEWKSFEKSFGMSDSELDEFSLTRGGETVINKILDETNLKIGFYMSEGINGNYIKRLLPTSKNGIQREFSREVNNGTYFIFVED